MAGKKLQIHVDKEVVCGTGFAILTKDLQALEPGITLNEDCSQGLTVGSKSVILESERTQVLLKQGTGDTAKLVNYTVSVTITRDPITDAERTAVSAFAAKGVARKVAQVDKDQRERAQIADRNLQIGKETATGGMVAGMQALREIAPVLKVLKESGLTQ